MMSTAVDHTYRFIRRALTKGTHRILEIGCGDGALAARLVDDGFSVVAIDSDEDAVATAKHRGVEAHIATWPAFSDGAFDAVLFTRSLHHMDDLTEAVEAAFSALSDGGRIVVEDFDAGFADEPTLVWFSGLLATIAAQGGQLDESDLLSELVLGERPAVDIWRSKHAHGHRLHGFDEILAALREAGNVRRVTDTAYFFRYLAEVLPNEKLIGALAKHETELIDGKSIRPLGKRAIVQHCICRPSQISVFNLTFA